MSAEYEKSTPLDDVFSSPVIQERLYLMGAGGEISKESLNRQRIIIGLGLMIFSMPIIQSAIENNSAIQGIVGGGLAVMGFKILDLGISGYKREEKKYTTGSGRARQKNLIYLEKYSL